MKRVLCLILVLALLCTTGNAFALELKENDSVDDLTERVSDLFEELNLREKLDDIDLKKLVADIKLLTEGSVGMDDETLEETIRTLAEEYGLALNDEQVAKILKLCRSVEKGAELKGKAVELKAKAVGLMLRIRLFAHKAASVLQKAGSLLERFSGFSDKKNP